MLKTSLIPKLLAAVSGALLAAAHATGPVPNLARHALVGYWHNFSNPAGPAFPLSQVSPDWNVVVVAFGDDAGDGRVGFRVDPGAGSEAQFIADVKALKAQG